MGSKRKNDEDCWRTKHVSDQEIADAMVKYGGSFVQALGRAARLADLDNMSRLREAFPEYWINYAKPEFHR